MTDEEARALLEVIAWDARLTGQYTGDPYWWLWESRTGLCSRRLLAEVRVPAAASA